MINLSSSSPSEPIKRWEEWGQQLEYTLAMYFGLCAALDLPSLKYSPYASELVSKIDDRLQFFDHLTHRLDFARSYLARARNKLTAPILCLPDEILSKVFRLSLSMDTHAIDHQTIRYPFAQTLTNIHYRRLHALLGVCSTWRRVGLSQGSLCSTSLERAGGYPLHLVAELYLSRFDIYRFLEDILTEYGPRFKSINLKVDFITSIRLIIEALVNATKNSSGSLTDLSMGYFPETNLLYRSEEPYPPAAPELEEFSRVLGSVQTLRLRGIELRLIGTPLPALTELRLQDLHLSHSVKLEEYIWSLSSAPQLQVLEIISIVTRADETEPETLLPSNSQFPIVLPELRVLYLEDLYQDVFELVLGSIEQGTYQVTLNITNKCTEIFTAEEIEEVGVHSSQLGDFKVDTLMFGEELSAIEESEVRSLLELMPTVTTVYIDSCPITARIMRPFIRPGGPSGSGYCFPALTRLYVARSFNHQKVELATLWSVVASHPLTEIGLGISESVREGDQVVCLGLPRPNEQRDPFWDWLSSTVPKVIWLPTDNPYASSIPEFENFAWRL